MTLAVYRTTVGGWYFVAPAGLMAHEALGQRVSGLFARQIVALGALIEMQHDYNDMAAAARLMLELGVPAEEVTEALADHQRHAARD